MSDLNTYACTGRLGADAELRYSANGTAIWSCRMAVGYGYGDNAGTNWLRVSAFGKRAEGLEKLELTKGARIAVSGELRVREYDAKDGTKRTSVEVNATDVVPLGSKPERQEPKHRPEPEPQAGGFDGDDIPFAPLGKRQHWVA